MGAVARIPISQESLPNVELIQRTADVRDKHCIICLQQGMSFNGLAMHLALEHDGLPIDAPLEEWLEAEEEYVSEDEDDNSGSEEEHGNGSRGPAEYSSWNQYSSSEESSGSSASSKSKKKKKLKKHFTEDIKSETARVIENGMAAMKISVEGSINSLKLTMEDTI